IARDTDGNGKLEPPVTRTTLAGRRCRGPVAVYGVYGRQGGDDPVTRVASATGGVAHDVADYAGVLGDGVLRRAKDDAILFESAAGAAREIVPARCGARILHADPTRNVLVVACKKADKSGSTSGPVELHGLDLHKSFGDQVRAIRESHDPPGERYVHIR